MHIEELKEGEIEGEQRQDYRNSNKDAIVISDAKRALVLAGARALFYPTLLYNVVRNKMQSEFRWWDRVDEFILLGAVPFPTDVPRLKEVGVCGVVTLNEPYETLVPTSLYQDYNINHLVIPTRDYLFAPAHSDICLAVDFINDNASCGKTTYVHCKAGRGRSTTIVLCYLVKYRHMTPSAAYEYVRSIRPRVLLANAQWQAVLDFYDHVKKPENKLNLDNFVKDAVFFQADEVESPSFEEGSMVPVKKLENNLNLDSFVKDSVFFPAYEVEYPSFEEDGSMVVVTQSDLDGYNEIHESSDKKRLSELKLACKFQFAGQAAISRISCLWIRSHSNGKVSRKKLGNSMGGSNDLDCVGVDIHVY